MKKKIFTATSLSLVAIVLSGCAQKVWMKPGATTQDFSVDRYSCERDSRQSGYFGDGVIGAINMQAFFNRCMDSKGWSLEQKQPEEAQPLLSSGNSKNSIVTENISSASDTVRECFSKVRKDPIFSKISSRFSDEKTGKFNFTQMSSTDIPSASEAELLKKYYYSVDMCWQPYMDTLSKSLPPETYQAYKNTSDKSDADAAQIVRRRISYGEWSTNENQIQRELEEALKKH